MISIIGLIVTVVVIWNATPLLLSKLSFLDTPPGALRAARAHVQYPGIDHWKKSKIVLWKDKITINQIQTIPIDRVLNASVFRAKQRTYYSWNQRVEYRLEIEFNDKDGKKSRILCSTGVNEHTEGAQLDSIGKEINRLVGVQTSPQPHTTPYEL